MTEKQKKLFKLFEETKEKYPYYLLLFRCGDFYESYQEDAEAVAHDLGTTLITDEEGNRRTAFPHYTIDSYLPQLIRARHRVAICDAP